MAGLFCILKAIIGYFIMMLIGTNLLGTVTRGFLPSYKKDIEGNRYLLEDVRSIGSVAITIFFSLLTVVYFYILYTTWGVNMLIAGVMIFVSGIPDLLYEMNTGEKISFKNMPRRPIDFLCTLLSWAALPLIWYSLCY